MTVYSKSLTKIVSGAIAVSFILILAYIAIVVVFWKRPRMEWQGPSPQFKSNYDINGDGEISRAEWEIRGMGIPATHFTDSVVSRADDFIRADCDENGRLTWSEYYGDFFKSDNCGTASELFLAMQNKRLRNAEDYHLPTVLIESQVQALSSTRLPSYRALQSFLTRIPPDVYEGNIGDVDGSNIRFSCEFIEALAIPTGIGWVPMGDYPAASCSLDNAIENTAITLLVVNAHWRIAGEVQDTLHVKSAYIPPQSGDRLIIYFPLNTIPIEVELLDVRGMPKTPY